MTSTPYPHLDYSAFGGVPWTGGLDTARAVVLPLPLDRTTSYVPGTRNGPREILRASAFLELWDEEVSLDVQALGIATLPEMEFPAWDLEATMFEIRRIASDLLGDGKFIVAIGGEHSITPPLVEAASARASELTVLQIDAHADLRASYMGSPHSHACAMRRALEHATRATQVGIRSLSAEEADALPGLQTTIFYDVVLREDPAWIDQVVETLGRDVYITIDLDGLDPGVMPAVGTPEPGGLSWHELLGLLRRVFAARQVVGCDVVELCPIPGLVAPNFLAAKLVSKLLAYKFAPPSPRRRW